MSYEAIILEGCILTAVVLERYALEMCLPFSGLF